MNTVTRVPVFFAQGGRPVIAEVGSLIHGTARPDVVSIATVNVSVSVPVEGLTAAVFDAVAWTSPDGLLGAALDGSDGTEWLVVTAASGDAEVQLFMSAPLVRSYLAEVLLAVCTADEADLVIAAADWLQVEGWSL